MQSRQPPEWDGSVLLVADPVASAREGDFDRRIDRPTPDTVDGLGAALRSAFGPVTLITDLGEFTDRAGRYQRSLVFPYWFGEGSRNRHGLVPAICEANGMMYVGADAYTKIICNDKELSKAVCLQAGLATPRSGVVRSVAELRFLRHLRLPVIVKPNYEGTSLGISERNKCADWKEAEAVAAELLRSLGQPLVVEEFVPGREFSTCLMRGGAGIEARTGSWVVDGDPSFLDDRVFSASLKVGSGRSMVFERQDDLLPPGVLDRMADCMDWLGKVDLLRIDCRRSGDGCTVIELTPDIYLGADGEFAVAYGGGNSSYERFVSTVVRNCIEGYGAHFPV